MRKIKVLQIAAVDVTVKFMLLPLVNALKGEGYDVQAVCSDGSHVSELREKGHVITAIQIDRKIHLPGNLRTLFALYGFIRKNRFDIVHVHSPVAGVLGRLAARLAGVPVIIYTAHGFYFHENMQAFKRSVIIGIERIMGRFFTDMLLTQSREDRKTAFNEGIIGKDKIEWISNGVDIERFKPALPDKDLRSSLGISEQDKVIGFAGRLVREKGIEELILAIGEVRTVIPEARLLIVGDTLKSDRDTGIAGALKKIISDNALENSIIFAGFREDLPALYNIMDVFVLPSHREGMPRSVIEAMACARPVIATDIRGSREEVVDGVTGRLVPVADTRAIACAIKEILSDNDFAGRMGRAGRKRAEEKFDEKIVLERELKIYGKLTDEKNI
ncbi:MAG: glycosyltransferase family 4 protein [Candidatus Omnitrophota bacterium]